MEWLNERIEKKGYEFIQYVSFGNVIESSKDEYSRVLMEAQQKRYKDKERISPWVLYFMQCLIPKKAETA